MTKLSILDFRWSSHLAIIDDDYCTFLALYTDTDWTAVLCLFMWNTKPCVLLSDHDHFSSHWRKLKKFYFILRPILTLGSKINFLVRKLYQGRCDFISPWRPIKPSWSNRPNPEDRINRVPYPHSMIKATILQSIQSRHPCYKSQTIVIVL